MEELIQRELEKLKKRANEVFDYIIKNQYVLEPFNFKVYDFFIEVFEARNALNIILNENDDLIYDFLERAYELFEEEFEEFCDSKNLNVNFKQISSSSSGVCLEIEESRFDDQLHPNDDSEILSLINSDFNDSSILNTLSDFIDGDYDEEIIGKILYDDYYSNLNFKELDADLKDFKEVINNHLKVFHFIEKSKKNVTLEYFISFYGLDFPENFLKEKKCTVLPYCHFLKNNFKIKETKNSVKIFFEDGTSKVLKKVSEKEFVENIKRW